MNTFSKYQESIASGVRRLRKERRWTQSKFAKLLNLSQSRFSEIERGNGSFTAEQFLLILKTFNVSINYFIESKTKSVSALQNALARLGAHHLQEETDALPSEKLDEVNRVIEEALTAAWSSRQIASLANILVLHFRECNLNIIWQRLWNRGLANRLGWLAENTLHALESEMKKALPKDLTQKYKRAETFLSLFLQTHRPQIQQDTAEDVLDSSITSQKTLELVREKRSEFSKKWHIITRITHGDFQESLGALLQ